VRLLVVVGASGALVAGPGDLSQVVLAHVNRQSLKSAALALAQPPHSLGMVHANRSRGVNGPRGPYGSRLRLSMTGTRPSDRLGRFRAARSIG
jgi:hypothetical protein